MPARSTSGLPAHEVRAINKGIGEQIRRAMALSGMSQADLGRRLGLSQPSINKLLAGKGDYGAVRMVALSRIFDRPISYFYGAWEAEPNQATQASDAPREAKTSLVTAVQRHLTGKKYSQE